MKIIHISVNFPVVVKRPSQAYLDNEAIGGLWPWRHLKWIENDKSDRNKKKIRHSLLGPAHRMVQCISQSCAGLTSH